MGGVAWRDGETRCCVDGLIDNSSTHAVYALLSTHRKTDPQMNFNHNVGLFCRLSSALRLGNGDAQFRQNNISAIPVHEFKAAATSDFQRHFHDALAARAV